MKKLMTSALAITAVMLSFDALAERITIRGEPIAIEKRGDFYYVPSTFQPTTDYYYVTVEGSRKVCYKTRQPNISVEPTTLNVEVSGARTTWDCYAYDANYFVVEP